MFPAYPCLPGTLFHTFVPGKLPIFSLTSTNSSLLTLFYTIQFINRHINVAFWMKWRTWQTWVGSKHHSTTSSTSSVFDVDFVRLVLNFSQHTKDLCVYHLRTDLRDNFVLSPMLAFRSETMKPLFVIQSRTWMWIQNCCVLYFSQLHMIAVES